MRKLNNENRIDRAIGAVENASTGEEKMSNSSTKTPWHLHFGGNWKTAAIVAIVGAGLFAAPLKQINSQSDTFDIPGDFDFADIQYDVFPSANPQWMHSMLTPSLSAVDCSRIVWLSWPTYSQSYEGQRHYNYFCVGNYRKLMDCVTDAEKNRKTAIVNALIDNVNCLEKARNTILACLAACAFSGPLILKCTGVCSATGLGLIANCNSDYDAAIAKINNNADAAIDKCIDKYKTPLL